MRGRWSEGKHIQGAPDLVVEVLSTTEKERDRVVKREVYAGYGVSEYWAVDPCCKTIEVMVLSGHNYGPGRVLGAGDALKSDVLPG